MANAQSLDDDQRRYWNGPNGDFWASQQELMDRTMAHLMQPLLEFAAPEVGSTVIDVGCGCGSTTLELARAVGASGKVLGIDISEPMLRRARERLAGRENAAFALVDAAAAELDVHADLLFSRFGVMFFGDPVAAFTNLRRAMKAGGRVRFACWRPLQENPWMLVPLEAVLPHIPKPEPPDPEAPGPFAFASTDRVTQILESSGFMKIEFRQFDFDMVPGGGASADEAATQMITIGAAARALQDQPEDLKEAARVSIREVLEPYQTPDGLRLRGSVWLVAAEV